MILSKEENIELYWIGYKCSRKWYPSFSYERYVHPHDAACIALLKLDRILRIKRIANIKGYYLKIVKTVCILTIKAAVRENYVGDALTIEEIYGRLLTYKQDDEPPQYKAIRDAFKRLSRIEQQVCNHCYIEGHSLARIRQELDLDKSKLDKIFKSIRTQFMKSWNEIYKP